jgi:hypothetical protein
VALRRATSRCGARCARAPVRRPAPLLPMLHRILLTAGEVSEVGAACAPSSDTICGLACVAGRAAVCASAISPYQLATSRAESRSTKSEQGRVSRVHKRGQAIAHLRDSISGTRSARTQSRTRINRPGYILIRPGSTRLPLPVLPMSKEPLLRCGMTLDIRPEKVTPLVPADPADGGVHQKHDHA